MRLVLTGIKILAALTKTKSQASQISAVLNQYVMNDIGSTK